MMCNIATELFCICFIICFITDVSGVVLYIKKAIFRFIYGKTIYKDFHIKLLECSLCQTWWSGLIYLLITGNLTIPAIAYVALLSAIAENISNLIFSLKDFIGYLTNKLSDLNE